MIVLVMDMPYDDFIAGLQQLLFLFLFTILWGVWLVYHSWARGPTTKRPTKKAMWTALLIYSIVDYSNKLHKISCSRKKKPARGKQQPVPCFAALADSQCQSCLSKTSLDSLFPLSGTSSLADDEILRLSGSPPSPPPVAPMEDSAGCLRCLPRPPGAGLKKIRCEIMTHHPVKFNIGKKHFEGLWGCPTPESEYREEQIRHLSSLQASLRRTQGILCQAIWRPTCG